MIRRTDPRVATLSQIGILAGARPRQLDQACSLTTEVRLPAGAVLCSQGEEAHEVFLLVEGDVAVSRDGRPLGVLGAGDVVGELAVLDGQRRTATAVALDDVVMLVMSTCEFARLLDVVPAARINLQSLRETRKAEIVALSAAA